jgi:hypothetical protein
MRAIEVIEVFPLDEVFVQVHVVGIRQQLVEFTLVCCVGPFHFPI